MENEPNIIIPQRTKKVNRNSQHRGRTMKPATKKHRKLRKSLLSVTKIDAITAKDSPFHKRVISPDLLKDGVVKIDAA